MSKRKYSLTTEPIWDNTEESVIRCVCWYRTNTSSKNCKKWTLEYLKKNGFSKENIEFISVCDTASFEFVGPYCRISNQADCKLPTEGGWQSAIDSKLNSLIFQGKRKLKERKNRNNKKPKVQTTSIQERIENQVSEFIGDLESKIDSFLDRVSIVKKSDYLDVVDWLKEYEVKSIQSKMIADYFRKYVKELKKAYSKKDEQLTEGYSFLTRPQLKKFIDFVEYIVTTCNNHSDIVKKARKPRRKKKKAPGVIVKKLQYEKENKEFGIKSIDPKMIIGATKLIVFNTKYKKLTIFESSPHVEGLSVKGTTIVGFDEKKSREKTVRKPKELLKDCASSGIRAINNKYNKLTTKEKVPTGRINKNCVILQVMK
jgi:hypothetical protein